LYYGGVLLFISARYYHGGTICGYFYNGNRILLWHTKSKGLKKGGGYAARLRIPACSSVHSSVLRKYLFYEQMISQVLARKNKIMVNKNGVLFILALLHEYKKIKKDPCEHAQGLIHNGVCRSIKPTIFIIS